ncbi:hypothetical protein ACTFIV_008315 [Dictyostelium citrinum]
MIKSFVIYILLLFSHSFINSQSTIGLDDLMIKSPDDYDDVSRSFTYSTTNSPPSFNVGGSSNLGTILNTSSVFDTDEVSYKLKSTLGLATIPPTFYFQYFNTSYYSYNNINEFKPNCISSIFMPTYIVEYEEINNQDGFQYGYDNFLGYVNLAQLTYRVDYTYISFDIPFSPINGDDVKVFQFNLTSVGDYENLITIVLYFSSSPVNLGDGKIMSSELLRFDILINGYFNSKINKKSSNECFLNGNVNGNSGGKNNNNNNNSNNNNNGGDDGSPIKIGCISTGASNNLKSRLAVTSFLAVLEYDISMNNDGNKININGFPLAASFSWLTTAQTNVDNEIGVANIYTDTHNINTNEAIIFGSNFVPVAITGNVNSKFLTQSFDAKRPDVVLWTSYFGIPSKYDTNNSNNNLNLTFSINLIIIISLILFIF